MSESVSPLVTVIIATFNKSSTLGYAIESVLWQTFNNFELWVIGDCCTDDSAEVVESFGDPRIHWYNLPKNTGYQSEPNNEGMRRSKGKYIAYLNHDDIWLPNHLQKLVEFIEKTDADFVFSILEHIGSKTGPGAHIPNCPEIDIPPEATATLHRKDVIKDIGYWKKPSETYSYPRAEYFRRARSVGKKFILVPALTALKFKRKTDDYAAASQQPEYMNKIRSDPEFVQKELSALLIRAYQKLEHPFTIKNLRLQVEQWIRRFLIKRGFDPAGLRFWRRRGSQTKIWRKGLGLEKKH